MKQVKTQGSERTWQASWIEPVQKDVTQEPAINLLDMFMGKPLPPQAPVEERLHPCPLLKRSFELAEEPASAILRCTARGLYKATLNGSDVTECLFAPEYTAYDSIILYQTYDVTGLVHAGTNVWGVRLADGWYAGRVAVSGDSCQFGNRLSYLGELEITYADGRTEVVGTDERFVSSTGKYVYADIQLGEKWDLRLADDAWDVEPEAEGWQGCSVVDAPTATVVSQTGPAVVRHECLAPVEVWDEDGATVVDFGQVIAGRCRLELDLAEGQEVTLEHAEALDAEGRFFMNIVGRNKDARDTFVGRGQHEMLEPDFTFRGFRYVRVSGLEDDFDPSCIWAYAIYSELEQTGHVETSDARVNRLLQNALWSQRGNMLSIPTDCPQRERVGWTGDIQVYAPTGCFFMDLDEFLGRWLEQVMADQMDDGQIVDYSPTLAAVAEGGVMPGQHSSAGWGDAIVTVPWELYRQYGDVDVLARCYDAMLRWHDYCVRSAAEGKDGDDRYVWDTAFCYGDWLLPSLMAKPEANPMEGALATKDPVATAWLAHSSDLLAQVSDVLGRAEKAAELRAYAADVRRAYAGRFYEGEGRLSSEFQGCYVTALAYDMLPEAERQATADHLAAMVRAAGDHLDTGFLSVSNLLDVLGDWGHADVAEDVFWQSDAPGWLYEVDHGATTIWENWTVILPNGDVMPFSFNHYAFGCVADWIVRRVGGLVLREPGYMEFDVAPAFVRGFEHARVTKETAYGTIELAWEEVDGGHRVELTVPAGTTAHVRLPGIAEQTVAAGTHSFVCA